MKIQFIPRLVSVVCLSSLLTLGCGKSNEPPTSEEADDQILLQVGDMYRSFQSVKNRPPSNITDLGTMRAISGNAFEAVRTGAIVLLYGTPMTDIKEEPGPPSSNEVLAYQKEVPEKGGRVLMLDRNVKSMTAEEFKAAKKAKK